MKPLYVLKFLVKQKFVWNYQRNGNFSGNLWQYNDLSIKFLPDNDTVLHGEVIRGQSGDVPRTDLHGFTQGVDKWEMGWTR